MPDRPLTLEGTIKTVNGDKGFGFIACQGTEYFFHRSGAAEFDTLRQGDRVHFVPRDSAKGPRAEQVVKA